MINRELIRMKTVQVVYAYYLNEGKSVETAERELFHSLAQAYELYQQMFLLMISVHDMGVRVVETQIARANRLGESITVSTKFTNNRFMAQLKSNGQLRAFRESHGNVWLGDEEFLRRLYGGIVVRDFYANYAASKTSSYGEDRDVWRKVYRHVLCNNDELDDMLEGMNLYWNDDKVIVDTFVLKTIKHFEAANSGGQELLPDFASEEDRRFASTVLRNAITNATDYQRMIAEQAKNWELSRIARMDLVIMQAALAEILTVPDIPISVSINEYVEIAKDYSTPRSGQYVNGVLDTLSRKLIREGAIIGKTMTESKQI